MRRICRTVKKWWYDENGKKFNVPLNEGDRSKEETDEGDSSLRYRSNAHRWWISGF